MKITKKIYLVSCLLLVACCAIKAQNLIPNSDFENHTCCPQNIGGAGDFPCASQWIRVQCSPDYFNPCDVTPNNLGVPSNAFGNQSAHSGVAYGGFYTFNKSALNGGREYIEAMLSTPLVSGKKYLISFYVSLADYAQYVTNTIGAYFSSMQITGSNCNRFNLTPQIQNTSANPLTDKNNWMLISDTLYANGGEQYMTIGNFKFDSLSDTLFVGGSFNSSYYYIDDVSVIDVADIGIQQYSKNNLQLTFYPNPTTGIIYVSGASGANNSYSAEVYDISGKLIYKNDLLLENGTGKFKLDVETGAYLLYLNNNENKGTGVYKIMISK